MSTNQVNRKILHAIRRNGTNSNTTNVSNQSFPSTTINNNNNLNDNNRRGEKRKKNLANERLKRLRTTLNEDVFVKQQFNNNSSKNCNESSNSQDNKTNVKSANERLKQLQATLKKSVGKTLNGPRNRINKNKNDKKRHAFTTNDCDLDEKKPNLSKEDTVFGFSTATVDSFTFRKTVNDYSPEDFVNSLNRFAQPLTFSYTNNDESMEWSCSDNEDDDTNKVSSDTTSKLYIVVDSNILLSHLDFIKSIVENNKSEPPFPVIYIPWIVVEELNYFKDSCLRRKAQDANRYISKVLQENRESLIGQSVEEVCEQKNTGKSADDKILACCLQVKEKYSNMVFLTNDINLKVKAQLSLIPVCSYEDILKQLNRPEDDKFQQILDKMTNLCSTIIRKAAQDAYGDIWKDMDMLKTSPRNIKQCIEIFKKYWFCVFEDLVLKQFTKAIDDLSDFLNSGRKDLNQLVILCVRICVYLKDIQSTMDLVEATIREINQIKDSH